MKSRNGYFQLVSKEDGTYLRIVAEKEGGNPVSYDRVAHYLDIKHITDYDTISLSKALSEVQDEKTIKLNATPCLPENEYLEIFVNEARTKATGMFYPPSDQGNEMSKQEIMNDLVHHGIRCGAKEDEIDRFVAERNYCTEIVLAEAIMPVEGHSAVITYNFRTEGFGKPKINEDGSVDFHQLDMINKVNAGDVLATLDPVDYGKPGIDVFGNVLRPAKVVAKILRHGNNIHLSEDKLTMYSDVAGHVMLAEDRVFVSDTYDVPADVSVASGDIEYDGNVVVHGNVVTGFSVRAKGDIIVEGVVEGATLIADGQIILKRGIQGMGRGKLISKGNITARFIENCEVQTNGSITTDAIMHSKVTAKDEVIVTGKKSMITGGNIHAGRGITAKVIGSAMCTQTNVCIGIDDAIIKEQKEIEKALEELRINEQKFTQALMIFKKKMDSGAALSDAQKRQIIMAKQEYTKINTQIAEKEARNKVLKEEIANFAGGRIKFSGVAYPGVKVEISNASMYVKDEISHGQFVLDRGEIKILAL